MASGRWWLTLPDHKVLRIDFDEEVPLQVLGQSRIVYAEIMSNEHARLQQEFGTERVQNLTAEESVN